MDIVGREALALLAGRIEPLVEVAVPVEHAHTDDWNAEVAGGLDVIAGENAKSAGIQRHGLADAEFHRHVGGSHVAGIGMRLPKPGIRLEIAAKLLMDAGDIRQILVVAGLGLEPIGRHRRQEGDRVMQGRAEQVGIQTSKQRARGRVPRPPEVVGELMQRGQLGREHRPDVEDVAGIYLRMHADGRGSGLWRGQCR